MNNVPTTTLPASILVVDDNRENLRLLAGVLTQQEYAVRAAPDGRLALASVQAKLPDLILLDIRMPEMDGYQVCARLKADERTRDIPVIFISIATDVFDKVRAFSAGGVDYITKPFQVEEVLARVQTHLALRNLQKSLQEKNAQLERVNNELTREIAERVRAEDLLRAQRDLGLALSATSRFYETLCLCAETAIRVSGMDCGGVYLVDESSGNLDLAFHQGLPPDFVESASHYGADSANARLVMAGKPIYTRHQELGVSLDEPEHREGLRAIAVIPVPYEGRVIACLNIASHTLNEVPDFARTALETIATQIGNAIARSKAEEGRREAFAEALQATHALRQSRANLQTLFDSLEDFLFVLDMEGRILQVNPVVLKRLGYAEAELLGESVLKVHPPDRREEAAAIVADMVAGKTDSCPVPVMAKDGTLIPVETKITRGRWDDRETLFGISRDITERVRADEAVRRRNQELALLNRLGRELTATLNLQQVTEQLLQAVTEIIGAEGASVWLRDVREPQSNDEEQEGWLVCWAVFHRGQGRSPANLRLRPGQGVAGWVVQNGESVVVTSTSDDLGFSPSVDEQTGFRTTSLLAVPLWVRDAIIGVLEVVNKQSGDFDVDDRVLIETLVASAAIAIDNARLVETLRQRTMELEARNKELDAFAHTVAHDLKNPLARVVGFAEVLKEDHATLSDEEIHDWLGTITKNGRKMSFIIDELLLLSSVRKVEEIETHSLDMASIVTQVQDRLAPMIEEYQAEIILPQSWPEALGYGPWIEEVWANYLDNALKYGGRPPRVELGFSISDFGFSIVNRQSSIVFWIRDNGPGIPPEDQDRLFTLFTRLDQVRVKGHGLGLSIVRRIVEKLGGEVGVESEVGQGSVFWFTLPQ